MNPIKERAIKTRQIRGILNEPTFGQKELLTTQELISPGALAYERAKVQALEIVNISQDADELENTSKTLGIPPPSSFGVFTTGHLPGENAVKIGELGKGIFQNYAAPEAEGHKGEVYAIPFVDGSYMLGFFGRAHPNEYFGNEYGAIIVAHQLRVIKELIKRERADLGIDPPVFLSYLAGAAEEHFLQKGQAGLVLSDTEFSNALHPGHGPVSILDDYIGSHFQGKFIPTSDITFSGYLLDEANKNGLVIMPVAAAGTYGTPEFQNPEELEMWKFFVERTRTKETGKWAEELFLNGRSQLTAVFDMGITFEQATLRQSFPDELPIKKIVLILTSDTVGTKGSLEVSHTGNVEEAQDAAPKYQQLLQSALIRYYSTPEFNIGQQKDFSIRAKLAAI